MTDPTTEHSDYFGTVEVEYGASIVTASDGDLWPTAWADDGHLYSANGDGMGFSRDGFADIVVNRLYGDPETGITGERLASGREVSPIWGDDREVNCKPTGLVAVDGNGDGRDELYLAVQDLSSLGHQDAFNSAPAASIVRSDDYGRSWIPTASPMFDRNVFTTIMFLDFGQSNSNASVLGDDSPYVYAYGLDGNWRGSYNGAVDDPQSLYLARVPASEIQNRVRWEFFVGETDGLPTWSSDIAARVPVLQDLRRVYSETEGYGDGGQSVVSQGGVVYNSGLGMYIYTSWSEFTFQFYVSPTPWGRWELFHEQDFGPYPWDGPRSDHPFHGGYATTIPSKFISADGRAMWVQSNWFWNAGAYSGNSYSFSLRKMIVEPHSGAVASNEANANRNLALPAEGAIATVAHCRRGHVSVLNDAAATRSEDSWNGQSRKLDHWGYTWPRKYRMDTIVFTSGPLDYVSGWFDEEPRIQVRVGGRWFPASIRAVTPPYPQSADATGFQSFEFTFGPIDADGVRLAGRPVGPEAYTTVSELAVYFRG